MTFETCLIEVRFEHDFESHLCCSNDRETAARLENLTVALQPTCLVINICYRSFCKVVMLYFNDVCSAGNKLELETKAISV